jgi:malonyl-CoA decarboxylase
MVISNWVNSVIEAGQEIMRGDRKLFAPDHSIADNIALLCEQLLSSKGEALGTALASSLVEICKQLDAQQKIDFLQYLASQFSAPEEQIDNAIAAYQQDPSKQNLYQLHIRTAPPRQELFRRINMAPDGTNTLVSLRADLLPLLKKHPELWEVDNDLRHLINSWFNRGFLKLVKIDWRTPANILEKLIAYEAVHSMNGWDDLRRRLASDRRCYAFFHPAMPDEPLIFVQVALTSGLASSVQDLLNTQVNADMETQADTAIFYSISDCQGGLRGISFGNFLIKQVVMELQGELSNLKEFATLSPIPGFCRWLTSYTEGDELSAEQITLLEPYLNPNQFENLAINPEAKELLTQLCAKYLYQVKRDRQPMDPVARFHLRNGASIGRLNWMGDSSPKGLAQSASMMVNYCYKLDRVAEQHEKFLNEGLVSAEKEFLKIQQETN